MGYYTVFIIEIDKLYFLLVKEDLIIFGGMEKGLSYCL